MVLALFFVVFVTGVAGTFLYARDAHAVTNNTINFQSRILQANGAVIPDGAVSVQFKLYNVATGGTASWTETQALTAKNGYVSASLGSVTSFPGTVDWSQEQWLTMNVNGDGEMGPTRMKVTAVPYSFRSGQADTLTNGASTITASQLAQLAPGTIQGVNSASTAISINQTGAGNLLQLQGNGTDSFTVSKAGDVRAAAGITVGNSSSTTAGTIRWTGSVFEGYNGSSWTSLGSSALGNPIINKVKLVDETQNSTNNATATLQNDDELFFAIGANETWTYRFLIYGNANATPDYKFAVTAPAGATCKVGYSDPEGATSISNLACGVSTGLVPGNTANDFYEVIGTVTNGATAGTVQLQWAQNTANVANSVIYAGSSVLATRAVGANGTAQAFIQNGNSFGAAAFLGTNDGNNLNFITNGLTRLTVLSNGNVGVGDTNPSALFTVGSGGALKVTNTGDLSTTGTLTVNGQSTFNNNIVAGGVATGTTGTTSAPARTNVTAVTLTAAGAFANNDVIFINNAGQDYYTRIVSGAGTVNLTVSPAVSYDAGAAVTKYTVQNIGATSTDYTTQANRFFQGYFLGGVVVGAGSTTISDGLISRTTGDIQLTPGAGGNVVVNGTINATTITGNGSGLTNIDGSQITGGSIADASLSANVTVQGNTFNGVNQLVQLDGAGALPALNGAALTTLNGTNISTGTVADARLSANVTLAGNTFNAANSLLQLDAGGKVGDSLLSSNVTLAGNTFNGVNQLVQLDGTGKLPALDASNLTNINGAGLSGLNASNISSGTLADARLSANVTVAGNTFNGISQLVQLNGTGALPALNAANLTSLNGTNISSGTVADARLSTNVTLAGNTFNGSNGLVQLTGTGALPALNGTALTTLNGSNISTGTVADARLSTNVTLLGNTFNGNNQLVQLNGTGALPALNAANLTALNGTNISSGTVSDARLSTNVTLAGNTFNGVSQLVLLDGTGAFPALNGAAITSINGSNIASGTVADARLSANVTLSGNTFNGVNQLLKLDASGKVADSLLSSNVTVAGNTFNGNSQLVQLTAGGLLPVLSGANLTSLNGTNISSGTVADARLSTNVTLKGNTFNGIGQLVLLDGTGALPALNGAAITSINGSNIASGTVADARLSANVTLSGNTFNGVNQLVRLDGAGALPALNGSALTTLNGTNISTGTVANARLSASVTLAGNTFNGASQLVLLDGTGALPALNGGALTTLNATNVSSGTIADARLSTNVALLTGAQSFTGTKTFAANIVLGTDTATPTAGALTLNDGTAANGFTSVLGTNTLTASRAISLPDEAGTVCLRNSTLCGYALIGAATAQTDATTNPSLFINKTGATGNILTLQDNGSTVFSVLNNGALAIQTTATNAINVKNAGGTDYFNVDTSGGIVRIGSSTSDAVATFLVLDTYNTAADPAGGVNGAMYYNGATNKSRCFQGGIWQDCITASNRNKAADQTVTNSAAFTNDTALVYSMAANASYKIDATINYSTTSAAADFKYTVTVPAGATVYLATDADTAATTRTICNITASGQTCTLANTANFRGIIHITGVITLAATAGNVQFQFAQNTATAGQSVTVYKGSVLQVTRTDQ